MGTSCGALAALALLAGCPTVDLGDTPTDLGLCNPPNGLAYFQDEVWPNFVRPTDAQNGCTANRGCHNEGGGNALSYKTQPVDDNFNFAVTKNFLNCGTPNESELFTKPLTGRVAHGGGDLIPSETDARAVAFLNWFQ